jgi:hypothetical protein
MCTPDILADRFPSSTRATSASACHVIIARAEFRDRQHPILDDHVVAQVLSALAPAALELSVTAARQAETRRAEAGWIWRQRLERADFACDWARRHYQLAEPENRLVTRQLERKWEAALAERGRLGEGVRAVPAAAPGAAVARRTGRDPISLR